VSDEEILQVATAALLDDPTASTSTIAERLGLSQAALFKRFGTKAELIHRALGVENGPPWIAALAQGPDERPISTQLLAIGSEIESFFQYIVPRLAALRALGVDGAAMLHRCAAPPPVIGHQALTAWFARAQAAGRIRGQGCDPSSLATVFLGSFQGRAFWQHLHAARVGWEHRSAPDALAAEPPPPTRGAYVPHRPAHLIAADALSADASADARGGDDARDFVSQVVDVFWRGIRPEESP
jgi:AcrR family transcriptional regulator